MKSPFLSRTVLFGMFTKVGLALLALGLGSTMTGSAALPDVIWTNLHNNHHAITKLAFSPDGTRLASGAMGGSVIWRVVDGSRILSADNGVGGDPTVSLSFSSDNKALALGYGMVTEGDSVVYDISGTNFTRAAGVSIDQWLDGVVSLPPIPVDVETELDPYAIVGGYRKLMAVHYDFQTALAIRQIDPGTEMNAFASDSGGITCITHAPGGAMFAAGTVNGKVGCFASTNWNQLRQLQFTNARVDAIDFLQDGREVITVASNLAYRPSLGGVYPAELRLRRFDGAFVPHVFSASNGIRASALSPDGKWLAGITKAGDGLALAFWRVADGRHLVTYTNEPVDALSVPSGILSVGFSPDAKLFAYGTRLGRVVLAYLPLMVEEITRAEGQLIYGWTGGSGLYQVQRSVDGMGPWENVGAPTTATRATNAIAGTVFYRVQSLPIP